MTDDQQAGDSFGHQGRVLIVDDDENLLKFIRAHSNQRDISVKQ